MSNKSRSLPFGVDLPSKLLCDLFSGGASKGDPVAAGPPLTNDGSKARINAELIGRSGRFPEHDVASIACPNTFFHAEHAAPFLDTSK
jgi:hypothetical protein